MTQAEELWKMIDDQAQHALAVRKELRLAQKHGAVLYFREKAQYEAYCKALGLEENELPLNSFMLDLAAGPLHIMWGPQP